MAAVTSLVCDRRLPSTERCGKPVYPPGTEISIQAQVFTPDLCHDCSRELYQTIGDFIALGGVRERDAAVAVPGRKTLSHDGVSYTEKQVRTWAQAHGLNVAESGRISKDVFTAWHRSSEFLTKKQGLLTRA